MNMTFMNRLSIKNVGSILLCLVATGCSKDSNFFYGAIDPETETKRVARAPAPLPPAPVPPSPTPLTSPEPPPVTEEKQEHIKFAELQTVSRPLDILWIIDNSGSMGTYQAQVIANTTAFISQFTSTAKSVDWKMGLISTSGLNYYSQPPNGYIGFAPTDLLTYLMPNAAALFQAAVARLGTMGDATERVFEPVLEVFDKFPTWIRKDSVLALIMVTDAPDQGRTSLASFETQMAAKKSFADQKNFGIFAADDFTGVGPTGVSCDYSDTTWYYAGSVFEQYLQKTNGTMYRLCDNFGTTLSSIGATLVSAVGQKVLKFQNRPLPDSIVIKYRGQLIPGGPLAQGGFWRYDYSANMVVFHDTSFFDPSELFLDVTYEVVVP